jgi:AraC family transcriptional regulator of adaptative response/methylated-DNA-[protein]-cysteine methyltransferase
MYRPSNADTRLAGSPGVRFGIFPSPLGRLLIAASAYGICYVALGDNAGALERGLLDEFPEASPADAASPMADWSAEITRLLLGAAPTMTLPLDPLGTAFQKRVWAELRRIPRGRTRSYRDIAERIGQPSAVRAVAQACASNPVAVLIPCHRVVRSTGALGGYRWGAERKQALLNAEHAATETSGRADS